MSSVNRITIASTNYRLQGAGDFTEILRWKYGSVVAPSPVHSMIAYDVAVNLLGVSALMFSEQLVIPPPQIPDPCSSIRLVGGGVYTTVFTSVYDGDGVSPSGIVSINGGLPASNFC